MSARLYFPLLLALWLAPAALVAQIGITPPAGVKPTNDFEIYAKSGFLLQQKYRYVATDPTGSINDLSCLSPAPNLTAIAGILKDPNGDATYTAGVSLTCTQSINLNTSDAQTQAGGVITGIEFTVEQFDTEANGDDRVIIQDGIGNTVVTLYGNEWVGTQFMVNGDITKITFRTDNDANVGTGFQLRWRALVQDQPDPNAVTRRPFGTSFYFNANNGALRVGYLDQTQNEHGYWSFASGLHNEVTTTGGGAIGNRNNVHGNSSVAFGGNNFIASAAFYAATIGNSSTVVSPYSLAFGDKNNSGGEAAITGGRSNTAIAEAAIALGKQNSTSALAAVTIGYKNMALGEAAVALGESNTALVANSSAMGLTNRALGTASVALGLSNTAAAANTIAGGRSNQATAEGAVALGALNTASGLAAVAIGRSNTASGNEGLALGQDSQATGENGVAIGRNTRATGQGSTALGNSVSTNTFRGAFIIGDDTGTTTPTLSTTANQFTARFVGGFRMVTGANNSGIPTSGVSLTAGGTSWATLSDSTQKELFQSIDGPTLLRKIGGMKLTTWNYKKQRGIRHYGPMAQDFFSLFGHDALGTIGSDKFITTQDIEGLTLTAVQALVHENEQLKAQVKQLQTAQQVCADQTARLENRLNALEAATLLKSQTGNSATAKANRRWSYKTVSTAER